MGPSPRRRWAHPRMTKRTAQMAPAVLVTSCRPAAVITSSRATVRLCRYRAGAAAPAADGHPVCTGVAVLQSMTIPTVVPAMPMPHLTLPGSWKQLLRMLSTPVWKKRKRELNELAQSISYGNIHNGVNMTVHRICEVEPESRDEYDEVAGDLSHLPPASKVCDTEAGGQQAWR